MNYLDQRKLRAAREEAQRATAAADTMRRSLADAAAIIATSTDLMGRATPDPADATAWGDQITANQRWSPGPHLIP